MAGGINDKNASVSLLDMQRVAHPLVGILCLVENRRRRSLAAHVQVETESCRKDEDYTYGSLHFMLLSLKTPVTTLDFISNSADTNIYFRSTGHVLSSSFNYRSRTCSQPVGLRLR